MPRYDLRQLSGRDFEELTRDLLQGEWNVALEAFRTGRDRGIDLRRISAHNDTTVVQCKHFIGSGYSKLLSHLRSSEVEKVRALAPSRYVLVTSVELSPTNKDSIQELLQPFIRSPQDIIGANDVDGLLQRHADVARTNFKLWLTGTEMLERVLHNAEVCQTEFEIERVVRKLPIFVQNAAFPRAQTILDVTNVLVISGAPGIGKTTLAEMLLYSHLEQGYEPVVIQTDVREGKKLFNSKRRQVFYFDDFLGQTFFGEDRFPGGVNGDAALVDFVEMIKATGHSRFILTTREHLLQSAHIASERLRHSALLDHRCLLALADYSKGQRGRILYNHLYFSDLAREYKEHVLRDDFFLEVVAHKNFTPRLIEWLSSAARLRDVPSAAYQEHIRGLLQNPQAIWSHAFNSQISAAARNVLLVLYTYAVHCELRDLEPLWNSLNAHTAQKYNRARDPRYYKNALKELDNAFVTYQRGYAEFLNPSIRDMIAAEIRDCPQHAIDVIASAGRFQQIVSMVELSRVDGFSAVHKKLLENSLTVIGSITRLLRTPHMRWEPDSQGRTMGRYIDTAFEQRLIQIGRLASNLESKILRTLFEKEVRDLATRYQKRVEDLRDATSLVEAFDELSELKSATDAELQRTLLDAILTDPDSWWAEQLNVMIRFSKDVSIWSPDDEMRLQAALTQYKKSGIDDEFDNCRETDDYEAFRDELTTLGENLGVPFTRNLEKIEERLAELERPEPEYRGSARSSGKLESPLDGRADTDAAIRDVFGALLD
jgi:Restriction endonuclease